MLRLGVQKMAGRAPVRMGVPRGGAARALAMAPSRAEMEYEVSHLPQVGVAPAESSTKLAEMKFAGDVSHSSTTPCPSLCLTVKAQSAL